MTGRNIRPIAVSMGEPAGVGPDLILHLYAQRDQQQVPPFVVFGSASILAQRAQALGLNIPLLTLKNAADAEMRFDDGLPVLNLADEIDDRPGQLRPETAPLVIAAISEATTFVQNGHCRALVTAPIQKSVLYSAGFTHPGHTEFLAELCAPAGETLTSVMMLAHAAYRVVPVTIHIPLAEVTRQLTTNSIVETAAIVAASLQQRFGIAAPRLAVAGVNPHAGEDGTIGLEDRDIVAPAVTELCARGINAVGPLSADTLFHPPHWQHYDCVIAMYHDQALIPIKTIGFDEGVNVTLGLPIVRTSPDHGTALSLAGSGTASASSMRAAIRLADEMTRQ